jgi:hypothetical protein
LDDAELSDPTDIDNAERREDDDDEDVGVDDDNVADKSTEIGLDAVDPAAVEATVLDVLGVNGSSS